MIKEFEGAIADEKIRQLLDCLHDAANSQNEKIMVELGPLFQEAQSDRELAWDKIEQRLDDKYISLEPAAGVFCYLAAKAIRARRIIEFGTSFGISTIYLGMAVRDNGGGVVIGTEMVDKKARQANENVSKAGLSEFVDIRVGNALETLRDIQGSFDFFLNDGFPRKLLPVLKIVAPHIRPGGVVVTDKVDESDPVYREYLEFIRDPDNGFQSVLMGLDKGTEGMEFSVKVAETN